MKINKNIRKKKGEKTREKRGEKRKQENLTHLAMRGNTASYILSGCGLASEESMNESPQRSLMFFSFLSPLYSHCLLVVVFSNEVQVREVHLYLGISYLPSPSLLLTPLPFCSLPSSFCSSLAYLHIDRHLQIATQRIRIERTTERNTGDSDLLAQQGPQHVCVVIHQSSNHLKEN